MQESTGQQAPELTGVRQRRAEQHTLVEQRTTGVVQAAPQSGGDDIHQDVDPDQYRGDQHPLGHPRTDQAAPAEAGLAIARLLRSLLTSTRIDAVDTLLPDRGVTQTLGTGGTLATGTTQPCLSVRMPPAGRHRCLLTLIWRVRWFCHYAPRIPIGVSTLPGPKALGTTLDGDPLEHDVLQRLVRRSRCGGTDPVHHVPGILVEDLAEDGVLEVQMRCRRERDEELGTVRRRTRVRHRQ